MDGPSKRAAREKLVPGGSRRIEKRKGSITQHSAAETVPDANPPAPAPPPGQQMPMGSPVTSRDDERPSPIAELTALDWYYGKWVNVLVLLFLVVGSGSKHHGRTSPGYCLGQQSEICNPVTSHGLLTELKRFC